MIPRIETRTRVLLVIHRFEDRKSTNTGRLATHCLTNSEVVVRGDANAPGDAVDFPPGSEPVLLFPHEDAVPLRDFAASKRPVALVVPDGNWRQASKVRKRVPGLDALPCAMLEPGASSLYRLREETHPRGLATMEAIARALGVLEGEAVQRELERLFLVMVERTLWSRGELGRAEVTTGLPDGAVRHDPESGHSAGRMLP
jgi:DTW domain-containing protein YfiP